jgi:hypothetical protein
MLSDTDNLELKEELMKVLSLYFFVVVVVVFLRWLSLTCAAGPG